jgi:hypothetical protein
MMPHLTSPRDPRVMVVDVGKPYVTTHNPLHHTHMSALRT